MSEGINITDAVGKHNEKVFKLPGAGVEKELTAEIEVGVAEKPKPQKTKVSFKDNSFISDFVSKKTAEAPPVQEVAKPATTQTVEEVRESMKQQESAAENRMTVDDYEMIAEFLIDLIDVGGSTALRWYAKDNSDAPYSLPTSKKSKLVKQLAKILIRMEAKFPLGLLFVITLIASYITPFRKATETRKRNTPKKVAVKEVKSKSSNAVKPPVKPTPENDIKQPDNKPEIITQKPLVENKEKEKKKRGPKPKSVKIPIGKTQKEVGTPAAAKRPVGGVSK